MTKPSDTLARLRARSTEAGKFVLPLDPVWADKITEAYGALRRADLIDDKYEKRQRVAEAQATIDELTEQAGEAVVVFRFCRLSRGQYDELVSRNPPTAEQRKEDDDKPWGQRRVFDIDAFGPDLLNTVLIDPKLTLDEVRGMLNGTDDEVLLAKGEAEALLGAAMAAALSQPRTVPPDLVLP